MNEGSLLWSIAGTGLIVTAGALTAIRHILLVNRGRTDESMYWRVPIINQKARRGAVAFWVTTMSFVATGILMIFCGGVP